MNSPEHTTASALRSMPGASVLLHAGWMRLVAVLCALGVLVLLQLFAPGAWKHLDERLASSTWALSNSEVQERRLVIVDIDEKSVQALGPWPWPRERIAALLNALDAQGASLRIVDILFDGERDGDAALRTALSSGSPAVVAQLFSLHVDPPVKAGILSGALPERQSTQACAAGATPAWGYLASAPSLGGVAAGHITPTVDPDGVVRRVPGILCFEGKAYPALVVAALAAATGETPQWLAGSPTELGQRPETASAKDRFELRGPDALETIIRVGTFALPANNQGQLRVSYALPRDGFVAVSAVDVLEGRLPEGVLRGVWALLGSTAFGAGDAIVTPQGGAVGGVEVHAQMLAAALDQRTPRDPAWRGWLIALACGLVLLFTLAALKPGQPGAALVLPVVALLNLGWIFAAHAYLLLGQHLMVPWGTPALLAVLCASLLMIAEMMRVRLERERLYGNLRSYLPEPAARRLALDEPSASVLAERREATVMVLDLRNFSAFCEGRSAEESAGVLHRFYATVEAAVSARQGVVEHLVGDGIVAAWNASLPCGDHAMRALEAAIPVWREVVAQLPKDASRQSPALDLGIGIESGSVLVGSFGAARRRVHAVMGETVTVAVRLESLTGELAYPILLGPEVVARAKAEADGRSQPIKALGSFLLAGLSRSRRIYALQVPLDETTLHLVYSIDQDRALAS